MDTNFEIRHLCDCPEHLETVARWIYEEWWSDKPGHTVQTMASRLGEASYRNAVPISLVALLAGNPVGTVNLVANDNEKRPELTPWLAALLVMPEHRGRGVGSVLVRALLKEAARLGVRQLYLGTDIPEYYAKLGAAMYHEVSDDYCIMVIKTGV
ncbi:MAG: GNAT family N-acetyltransferase [Candidatus Marinimicrobia bacterium]|nr:GNAT family N-acetyltransferase [Candidatus Neomarinimicrobiota bacterium]